MSARRPLPLGPRLAVSFAAPAALAVMLCGAAAYLGTRGVLEAELGNRLCGLARVAATTVPADLVLALGAGDDDTRTAQNIRRRLEAVRVPGVSRVMVVDAEQRVRMDLSGELPIGAEAPRLALDAVELSRARAGEPTASVLFQGRDGRQYKSCYAAVAGEGSLVVAVDGAADLFSTLTNLAGLYGLLAVLALVLLSALAFGVARTLTRPLSRLASEVRAVGQGRMDTPFTVGAEDEVGQVARALDEMRHALRARDEERQMMLAGIAHEVRNPLGGMELYAGILMETAADLPAETPAHLRDELTNAGGRIRRELSYLSGVVNDFLTFARDTPPQRKEVHALALLEGVASLVAPEAAARAVEVRAVTPGGDVVLHVDEGLLKSALLNLAQNAVQACPPGARVELSARAEGDTVYVGVKDTGPGMTPEQLQSALTPFFTTKEKGTGLGMPLVVKIARTHGGRLDVVTSPGNGCHAQLVLPAHTAETPFSPV